MGRTAPVLAMTMLMLAGCSSSDAPPPAAAATASTSSGLATPDFTVAPTVGSANVSPTKVQFRLGARPVVGAKVPVSLLITPTAKVDRIQVVLEVEPGLAFVDESQSAYTIDATPAGTARPHELQVMPEKAGVYLLKATVASDVDGTSKASNYAIPFIVSGDAPAAPAATATPAPAPAAGG